jgi:hypothetical protein
MRRLCASTHTRVGNIGRAWTIENARNCLGFYMWANGGSFQLRQTALNAGYNEGIKQGRNDRNKRNRSDYRDKSAYRKATQDYSSRLGDRELYRRYYREAYPNGYDDGINGWQDFAFLSDLAHALPAWQ